MKKRVNNFAFLEKMHTFALPKRYGVSAERYDKEIRSLKILKDKQLQNVVVQE